MRIAQICPYSLSIPGGVQGQALGLARALRSLGHEARVLAPCDGPPPDSMVTPLGKSIPTAVNGSVAPIAPDPACALRTIHTLRNEEFDVLHLHEPLVPGPTATALLVADVPMVGTFHAAGAVGATSYRVPWLTRKLAKRLRVRVAVSQDASETAALNLAGHYEILFNGIDIDRFANASQVEKSGPTILFVGRHEPRKGLSILIDAMKMLPKDTRLWIAGRGPQTSELQAATKSDSRIEWLGRISDAEKASRLRSADVFCAPATGGESFGIVLLEAMAAGTPVVASDIPGFRNVIEDSSQAMLSKPEDPKSLADAIAAVLGDKQLASSLSTAGRSRAEDFSMLGLAEKYVEYYEEAISNFRFL